jgi:hypothetical protein
LMLSSDVVIWCWHWCCWPMLLADVVIWFCHLMFSSDDFIWCFHLTLSSDVFQLRFRMSCNLHFGFNLGCRQDSNLLLAPELS